MRASERHSAKIPARVLVFQRSLGAKVEMAGAWGREEKLAEARAMGEARPPGIMG